jgi:hypothetical protein
MALSVVQSIQISSKSYHKCLYLLKSVFFNVNDSVFMVFVVA